MPDTKEGREEQARNEERRQRAREISAARERGDEAEPPIDGDGPTTCHRRDCEEPATFLALERYQEGSGHGAVEAKAALCRTHAAEESPTNLDGAYDDYVFRVEPLPETVD